jgi:hypothetical protein
VTPSQSVMSPGELMFSKRGFEPTIPPFERAKTIHALDHEATVIGILGRYQPKLKRTKMISTHLFLSTKR